MSQRVRALVLSLVIGLVVSAVAIDATVAAGPPDPERGRAVFAAKRCDRCHIAGGAHGVGPSLDDIRRTQGTLELIGRLWNHVPAMWATLALEGVAWPDITSSEMADLLAYLGADPARDAAPDAAKGQIVLVGKGCLKCHSFRREGGTVRPDLAERRADYESPSAWAATMWTHTPRMVKVITGQQIPYPRFSGAEMAHLVSFLRSTAQTSATGTGGRSR
jgi:cytochrome c551/c552